MYVAPGTSALTKLIVKKSADGLGVYCRRRHTTTRGPRQLHRTRRADDNFHDVTEPIRLSVLHDKRASAQFVIERHDEEVYADWMQIFHMRTKIYLDPEVYGLKSRII
jgi:hypothetical protein